MTESMFAATEMVAGGEVVFEAMKVDQLKVELAERVVQAAIELAPACIACAGGNRAT